MYAYMYVCMYVHIYIYIYIYIHTHCARSRCQERLADNEILQNQVHR